MIRLTLARMTALAATSALALTLAPAAFADHVKNPGPVNAQTTFGWGKPQWQDDFVGPRKRIWKVTGPGVVQTQHGMLTLNTSTRRSVSATLTGHAHRTGRWEIRLRSRRYGAAHANYKVITELTPAVAKAQRCGARDISLQQYRLGSRAAHFYLRNLPKRKYTAVKRGLDLGADKWHTFAVEVTATRVSWFVDSHVLVSERRPKALSGALLTVRFKMEATKGARMNKSRMQMDWLRYFTLDKPNKLSVKAPRATLGTYGQAC
jgi:hypothetical protein